jgi:8-oxo-dGTP pyrophosphatase MutT (NUDIX family)
MENKNHHISLKPIFTSEEKLREILTGCSPEEPPKLNGGQFRCAAVLIPLFQKEGEWNILFTRRSESVQDHKGQVSFPGGAVEVQDGTITQTALREAYEEIGLKPNDVHILGCMRDMETNSNYRITPIVGVIPWPYHFHLECSEVSHVFHIPIKWLADDHHWRIIKYPSFDSRIHDVIQYLPYQSENLWGITARLTVEFMKIMAL